MILRKHEIKHYGGLESELIPTLPSGDTFFATDTNNLYKYNEDKLPHLIGDTSGGDFLPLTGGVLSGSIEVAGDIESTNSASGLILVSANGTRWRQTISNTGVPVYTQV